MNVNSKKYDVPDERRDGFFVFIWCFITSVLITTVCSGNSFLYGFGMTDDPNGYFSVGKDMLRGVVPYRDIAVSEGIFQYGIYAAAAFISETSVLGVFVMEVIACTMSMFAAFRIMQLYLRSVSMQYVLTPVAGMAVYASKGFHQGAGAEEFLFPFIMWEVYISLKYFREEYPEPVSRWKFFAGGILAGLSAQIKLNSLVFSFAWMLIVLIADMIAANAVKRAIGNILAFLFGIAVTVIPGLVYFGINNAILDWGRVYIYENISGYLSEVTFSGRLAYFWSRMIDWIYDNKLVYLTIFVGALYFTLALVFSFVPEDRYKLIKRDIVVIPIKISEYGNMIMLFLFQILVIFVGATDMECYPFLINGFALFGVVAVGYVLEGIYLRIGKHDFNEDITAKTVTVMLAMLIVTGIVEYCIL